MMGLGIAFLVALALFGAAGGSKAPSAPPVPPPDLPPVAPGPPDPSKPTATTKGKSGTTWITQPVGQKGNSTFVDVFLPDGQMGSHPTFRVLRYSQTGSARAFMESAPGVDPKVLALAMSDFALTASAAKQAGIDVTQMSPELQEKLANVLKALTVGPDGKIVGPVTDAALQLATAVAGELERAGFGPAAMALRAYVKAAQAIVPLPPKEKQIPLPPHMPADLQAMVNRALQVERDPGKLTTIVNALKAYKPQTPDIAAAIGMFEALIVQAKAQQSSAEALEKVQKIVEAPVAAKTTPDVKPPPPPGPPPAPPAPSGARVYTVTAADKRGPYGLAEEYTGNGNRWTELKPLNTHYDLSKQWWAGMSINLPASWPATKRGAAPAPAPVPSAPAPTVPTVPSSAGASRLYTVVAADGKRGPFGLAEDFTGNGNRWTELKPLNPHYDLSKQWWAGMSINLPASWPATKRSEQPAAPMATSLPEAPLSIPTVPTPGPAPLPKSPVEVAADAVVRNLKAVQGQYGMPGAHGREDQTLMKRYQGLAGLGQDGMMGPSGFVSLAVNGQNDLPLVMYWPKTSTAANVLKYRDDIRAVAARARAAGDLSGAAALEASAAREHGEGKISTGQLVP